MRSRRSSTLTSNRRGSRDLIAQRPGLRLPGAFDGFEIAARELMGSDLLGRVTQELGEPFDTGIESLDRLGLTPYRVAEAGRFMTHLGVPARRAEALASLGQAVADGDCDWSQEAKYQPRWKH